MQKQIAAAHSRSARRAKNQPQNVANGVAKITQVIADGTMPVSQYLWLHPEARLTDAERRELIAGLVASLK